jgi:ABC-type glycerol-3-phosphate transport system substrate-binding protein
MVVSEYTENKEEAWEFISWMHGPPKFRYLDYYAHEIGCFPPIKDFEEKVGWHSWEPSGLDEVNKQAIGVYLQSAAIAYPMPQIPDYEEIQDIIASEFENAIYGKKTAQGAMDDANDTINEILEKRARKR